MSIDAATLRAYRETEYRVLGPPGFVLRIGVRSPELVSLHAHYGVSASAFLTACNPRSRLLDARVNAERQAALRDAVRRLGHPMLDAIGQHPSNGWPAEESLLVLGISLDDARALGTRFDQNAIVWNGRDGVPRLELLR